MRYLLLLLFLPLSILSVKAGCISCWELRKVSIELTSGEKLVGFVKWNDDWPIYSAEQKDSNDQFPESFVSFHKSADVYHQFWLYNRIDSVYNDSIERIVYVVENRHQKQYAIDKVLAIQALENTHPIIIGAGELPSFSKNDIALLKTNPEAVLVIESSVAINYLFSYNPLIKNQELADLGNSDFWGKLDELYEKQVLFIAVSFD